MLGIVLQVVIAWVYSYVLEYFVHKHVLHNKKLKYAFKHHFRNHHTAARRNHMYDSKYVKSSWYHWFKDDEFIGLSFLAVVHLPVFFWLPYSYLTLLLASVHYFLVHRRAHADQEWARENLSWHYDHHLGPNQHKNWGVRSDIMDRILKTKEVYKGSKREKISYSRIRLSNRRGKRARSYRN